MEIVRYSMPPEDIGNEGRFVNNLRQIGIPKDSVFVDRKLSPPHIIVELHSNEVRDLVRTMAGIRRMKKEKAPLPEESGVDRAAS